VTSQKLDGEEIEEAAEEAADPIFRATEGTRAVLHDDLAYLEAARRCQHGDEAVKFPVQAYLAEHLRLVAFHAAVVIVQLHSRDPADERIENPTGPDPVPGIDSFLFPAADYIESVQRRQEVWYLGRIVLQVGIERQEHISLCRREGRRERRCL